MNKLNLLLQSIPKNGIILDNWLAEHGISSDLKWQYIRSKWLTPLGQGASYRTGDTVNWQNAVAALQQQLHIPLHIGGKTAIEFHGAAHFISPHSTQLFLYGTPGHPLPKWFLQNKWNITVFYLLTRFLPTNIGINEYPQDNGTMLFVSVLERAILELLYHIPKTQSIEGAYYIMENLGGLRPALLQPLLESCTSFKVKRLFFYLAERAGHSWVEELNRATISLGLGKRQIIKGGYLDPIYHITVPKNWKEDETPLF